MKIAVLVYHKNAEQIYPWAWIDKFTYSIKNQTYKNFDILECEYGGGNLLMFENAIEFYQPKLPTFVDALNLLLDKAFGMGYDYCLNTNVDDFYSTNRIKIQSVYMKRGYDIISSNFSLVRDDEIIHTHRFDHFGLATEILERNHNIICHPSVCYSKKFWEENRYVSNEIPKEDLLLWQRGLNNGNSFIISPEILCYHRIHNQSVCQSTNR